MNMTHSMVFRNRPTQWALAIAVVVVIGIRLVPQCLAGDWPQILGPHRSGVADDEQIADDWPETGPSLVWKHAVGEGLAGVAVTGGKTIVFHRVKDREVVEALDCKSGKPFWKADFPTAYVSRISSDSGPRSVPLVHGDRVFVVGAGGHLHCVSLASGKPLWSRWFKEDFGVGDSYFGAGSSPIVADGKLLLNVGGRDGAGIVAFSLTDGKTIWKATDEDPSYSSPVAVTIDGTKHVIFATRFNAVSVDPANGRVRFTLPFGKRGPTVNAANPIVIGRNVFLSASYGIGATFASIGKTEAKVQWATTLPGSSTTSSLRRAARRRWCTACPHMTRLPTSGRCSVTVASSGPTRTF